MAGHSKWKNIQHRKGAKDAQRGQIFTRLIREITLAARHGADPDLNARLRAAIDKALSHNMSKDTMQKAINKGAGLDGGSELTEVLYEGYGPGGVAFLVFCATDNTNRTVSEIRHLFSKCGGAMGSPGSVSFLFEERGLVHIHCLDSKKEALLEQLMGLDGMIDIDDSVKDEVSAICTASSLSTLIAAIASQDCQIISHDKQFCALTDIAYNDELAPAISKLYDKLDEHDDVQHLVCNFCFDAGDLG
jgi:YebC/PmpR family DNA-binding regulatory protein